jgi:hypothetical protein
VGVREHFLKEVTNSSPIVINSEEQKTENEEWVLAVAQVAQNF